MTNKEKMKEIEKYYPWRERLTYQETKNIRI